MINTRRNRAAVNVLNALARVLLSREYRDALKACIEDGITARAALSHLEHVTPSKDEIAMATDLLERRRAG